uniref:C-type lectin domain-containing protein n=1 Tax=Ciona intestinalis TaxID=7719 RepID=H2XPS0_CIOIN
MLFVLILLNLIVVTSTNDNWHQLDGIEYYIEYTAVIGVDKAKEGCKAISAILAVVKSQRIQDFLVKNINTTKLTGMPFAFYIGLSRTSSTTLQWSDGTTTNTSVFTYWDATDDVYDYRKLCVTMGFHAAFNILFKWKIEYCRMTLRYICQSIFLTIKNTKPIYIIRCKIIVTV